MLDTKKGYTLLELVIVVAVFSIILSAVFSSITSGRSSFQNAGYQIDRQQDARKAADMIAWDLKGASPSYEIDGSFYNISINTDGDQLDFYLPVFDEDNQIIQIQSVRYCINPSNSSQLIRVEGTNSTVVANNIDNVAAQKPFFAFANPSRTIVDIKIPVIRNNTTFTLKTQANLRNREIQLDLDEEEDDEGVGFVPGVILFKM